MTTYELCLKAVCKSVFDAAPFDIPEDDLASLHRIVRARLFEDVSYSDGAMAVLEAYKLGRNGDGCAHPADEWCDRCLGHKGDAEDMDR